MHTKTFRAAVALAAALAIISAGPLAAAHVTAVQATAPAGGYATIELQVPHGCDGQSTSVVSVQLRDDITSVTPQAVPGWEVSTTDAELDEPVEVHGEAVTTYVSEVTWTATGDPLADGQYLRFGISMKMPELVGETVLLPTVQQCVDGSDSAWIDADPESDHPAPSVELVAADADAHGAEEAGDDGDAAVVGVNADGTDTDEAAASAEVATSEASTSDTVARVLAVIAILIGVAAVVAASRRGRTEQ